MYMCTTSKLLRFSFRSYTSMKDAVYFFQILLCEWCAFVAVFVLIVDLIVVVVAGALAFIVVAVVVVIVAADPQF